MKLIIDCDPGHDDAAAILYAAKHLQLVGITTVFGNQDIAHTTRNALRIVELGELDVPVAGGMAGPWVGKAQAIPEAHGKTGLDGADLPDPSCEPISQHAVDFIVEQAHRNQGELVVAAVAPLTNVATALRIEPKLKAWLKAISIMGGSTTFGNVTPVAEFNIGSDPEAAHAVFNSGVPLFMCGLNVTRQAGVLPKDLERLRQSGGRVSRIFAGLLGFYRERLQMVFGLESASLHDPCALMPFIDGSLIQHRPAHVDIERTSELTRGMTVCDLRYAGSDGRMVTGAEGIRSGLQPNVQVAVEIDARRAVDQVLCALESYG